MAWVGRYRVGVVRGEGRVGRGGSGAASGRRLLDGAGRWGYGGAGAEGGRGSVGLACGRVGVPAAEPGVAERARRRRPAAKEGRDCAAAQHPFRDE